jgi:hypothetical protein
MPPKREVDARIGELEAELAKLRLIKQLHNSRSHAHATRNGHGNGNGNGATGSNGDLFEPVRPPLQHAQVVDPARLSQDRREILEIMMALPNNQAPLRIVSHKLRARGHHTDDKHVGANMARMFKAGLLTRVRQGTYEVPNHVAEYLREETAQRIGEGMP